MIFVLIAKTKRTVFEYRRPSILRLNDVQVRAGRTRHVSYRVAAKHRSGDVIRLNCTAYIYTYIYMYTCTCMYTTCTCTTTHVVLKHNSRNRNSLDVKLSSDLYRVTTSNAKRLGYMPQDGCHQHRPVLLIDWSNNVHAHYYHYYNRRPISLARHVTKPGHRFGSNADPVWRQRLDSAAS